MERIEGTTQRVPHTACTARKQAHGQDQSEAACELRS